MNKFDKPIFESAWIEQAQKISLWERIALTFVPKVRVENEESITYFKKVFGKFYLLDIKLK